MKAVNQATLNDIKKMSLNNFNRWIDRIFQTAFQEDMDKEYKRGFERGLNYGVVWMEDDLFRLLRSEGIGAERVNRMSDKDAVYRQDAIAKLKEHRKIFCKNRCDFIILSDKDKARVDEIDACIAVLINLPPAQPERKKGEWTPVEDRKVPYGILMECSECGHRIIINDALEHNYCSECGADMRQREENK